MGIGLQHFEPSTVGIALGLAGLSLSTVIALLGRVGDWSRSLVWWVAAALCMTAGFTFNALQGALPARAMLSIGNPLAVAGSCLFFVGLRHLVDRKVNPALVLTIVIVAVTGSATFTLLWPSIAGRVMTLALTLGTVSLLNIAALRQLDSGYYRFPARFLLVVNITLIVMIVLRAITAFTLPTPVSAVAPSPFNVVVYAITGLLIIGYLTGILLLCFAEKQTALRRLATHDALTRVRNRLGLRDALNTWPVGQAGIVTVFDIDHFKRVNDGYGHEAGDILLRTFAQALTATAPGGAIIVRLGGDEFCVVEAAGDARALPDVWIESLKEQLPTRLELASPGTVAAKVSHGSARFTTITGEFAEALREADRALYRSKADRPLWIAPAAA